MSFRLSTAAKLLHRPHLITPLAAEYWSRRMLEIDARAFRKTGRMEAIARKLGLARPHAWDDDDASEGAPPPTRPVAYAPMWMGEPDKQLDWGWSIKDGVAMMEISGPLVEHGGWGLCEFMHGYDTIAAAIAEADADTSVKAMLIRFDTPGGVVASGIYDLSTMLQARAADAKPLWAHCEMAASAGYWIASQFDRVLAPQAGLTGSIGVVMVHENHAAALDKFGVEITSIEAPEGGFKTDGAWWKALSDEGRAALQSDINELFDAFLATVEAGRGDKLTAAKARALGAQVFPATHSDSKRDAKALGLIDDVMSERDAFEALKAEISASPLNPIPAPSGNSAAKAAKPTKEMDMKTRAKIAAVLAAKPSAKTAEEKLADIQKIMDEEEDAAEGEDEDVDAEGEEDEDAPAAEGEDEETDAEDDEDKPAAVARKRKAKVFVNPVVAQAILALPEAKGREALAQRLAFKPGMTVEEAKADLAAAPRKSTLADRVKDPELTANGGKAKSEGRKHADEALAIAGLAPKKK
jgi:signal peptide peptidase SppA